MPRKWTAAQLFSEIVMPAQCELIRMEYRGVAIDDTLRKERSAQMEAEIETLSQSEALEGVNPWSPIQVREKLQSWKVTRAKTTNERMLKKIRARRPDTASFINGVLKCRELRKLRSTYLLAKTQADGRLHTSYRLFVTDTGRGRSGADVFDTGANLQNFPQSERDWIVPDDGLVMWAADASQIEARIVAWESGDESYITAFLDGRDVHAEHAHAMFNVPLERTRDIITGTWTYRDSGKRVTHSWGYCISAWGLVERVNDEIPELPYTIRDADMHLKALDKARPGVPKWRNKIIERSHRSRTIVTVYGRPRTFYAMPPLSERIPNSLHRAMIAHTPQSVASDHMHKALKTTAEEIRKRKIPQAECLLYTHDEIAGQCRPEDVEEIKEIVCRAIEDPMPLEWQGHELICPAEFGSGPNWKETHA